jgi:hypothetical protein
MSEPGDASKILFVCGVAKRCHLQTEQLDCSFEPLTIRRPVGSTGCHFQTQPGVLAGRVLRSCRIDKTDAEFAVCAGDQPANIQ